MGWCFSASWKTRDDMLAYLRRPERFAPNYELIKSSPRGNNHWYVAKRRDTGALWIGLDLMKGGTRRDPGWGYKDLDETGGPVETNCPISLIKMVLPYPTNDWGTEWRQRALAAAEAKKAAPRKAVGTVVKYGGNLYRLLRKRSGRDGWDVRQLVEVHGAYAEGGIFRMKLRQLAQAVVVEDLNVRPAEIDAA